MKHLTTDVASRVQPPDNEGEDAAAVDPHVTPYQRAQWYATLLERNLTELPHNTELRAWFESDATGVGSFVQCAALSGYNAEQLRESLRQRGLLNKEQ